ncbi:hypothetical protein COLO4_07206 [Corchorus olitorius]|uniref:Uncharacterized protein n=1 Tax=Corchorus olitorius TaxID=93759 RepID=A0A1R3KKI4_9ROSI|nr:hypothetical protein COLO4_07206 [Corchorus olitorius]
MAGIIKPSLSTVVLHSNTTYNKHGGENRRSKKRSTSRIRQDIDTIIPIFKNWYNINLKSRQQ